MHACRYASISLYVRIYVSTEYTRVYTYIHICIYKHVCMYVYVDVDIYIYISTYVHIHVFEMVVSKNQGPSMPPTNRALITATPTKDSQFVETAVCIEINK